MKIEVLDLQDQPDGSCLLTLEMSPEAVLLFAKKGILASFKEALVTIEQEHGSDPKLT